MFRAALLAALIAAPACADGPAPGTADPAVAREILGRLYVPDPASPISVGGVSVAGFGAWAPAPEIGGPRVVAPPAAVPVPPSAPLLAAGLAALAWRARRGPV